MREYLGHYILGAKAISVILNLTWGQVDLKEGFIKLRAEDTKTNEGRLIPLNLELVEMFKAMSRGFPQAPVFTYKGRSMWR